MMQARGVFCQFLCVMNSSIQNNDISEAFGHAKKINWNHYNLSCNSYMNLEYFSEKIRKHFTAGGS